MYLDSIICILVAEFASHTLRHRSERICQTLIFLHLLTLFRCQAAFACNVFVDFVYINETCCFIQKAP